MNQTRPIAVALAIGSLAVLLSIASQRPTLAAGEKPAALVPVEESAFIGGDGGGAYRTYGIDQRISPDARVTKIRIRFSDNIHFAVLNVFVNGKEFETHRCGEYGGAEGKYESVDIAKDETIKSIDVFGGKDGENPVVCRLLVRTDKQSVEIGVPETGDFIGTLKCPDGHRIVGICGRAGARLDSIGVQTIKVK